MKMLNRSGKDLKVWFEICTNNSNDWKEFLSLCASSFQNTEFSRRYLPDVEKRKLFLPHYFKYNYETKFSDGRAGLACLKTISDEDGGKPEIVLGSILVFNPLSVTCGDQTPMLEAYRSGAQLVMKRDTWLQNTVHTTMVDVAEQVGAVAMYGAYQAVAPKYKNMGLGAKYMLTPHKMLGEEGYKIERFKEQKKLPIVVYGLLLQSSLVTSKFVEAVNSEEVAHLHFDYRKGLACSQSLTYKEGEECSCVHVLCSKPHPRYGEIIPKMKKYFHQTSNL